jgi:hypothetical protein
MQFLRQFELLTLLGIRHPLLFTFVSSPLKPLGQMNRNSVGSIFGTSPDLVKPKTIKLIFIASPLIAQHFKEKVQRLVGSESG